MTVFTNVGVVGAGMMGSEIANSFSQSVHEILRRAYGESFLPRQMAAAGYDGGDSGHGWYRYDKDDRWS
jgi:3-hydroxyacyl-CoA dehydrogenase